MVSETSEDKVSGNGDPEKKGRIIANFYQNSLCNENILYVMNGLSYLSVNS